MGDQQHAWAVERWTPDSSKAGGKWVFAAQLDNESKARMYAAELGSEMTRRLGTVQRYRVVRARPRRNHMQREVSFNAGVFLRSIFPQATRPFVDWADDVMAWHGGAHHGYGPMSAVMAAGMKKGADSQTVFLTEAEAREMIDAIGERGLQKRVAEALAKNGRWYESAEVESHYRGGGSGPQKENPSVFNNGPWVAPDGNEIRGGDLIEYYQGGHGRDSHGRQILKVKRSKVVRLLIFDDHVIAGTGMGDYVDAKNYIRLVRRASRGNPGGYRCSCGKSLRGYVQYLTADFPGGGKGPYGPPIQAKECEKCWKPSSHATRPKKTAVR